MVNNNASIEIVLKKSLIGANKKHVATAKSFGLRKIGDRVVQPNNAATKGKIAKIIHLLTVFEQKGGKNWI